MSWIETYTGRRIDPLNPDPNQIEITDIAHALSMICRFTGHAREFWSVGQHSLFVAEIVDHLLPSRYKYESAALFHDASEAYLCDIARPVKENLPEYQRHEAKLEQCIAQKFGLQWPWPEVVKRADWIALAVEAKELMPSRGQDWNWPRHENLARGWRLPRHLLELSMYEVEEELCERMNRCALAMEGCES